MAAERMRTADGREVEAHEGDGKGRRWCRFATGNTGWLEESTLTPDQARPWPPEGLEAKTASV